MAATNRERTRYDRALAEVGERRDTGGALALAPLIDPAMGALPQDLLVALRGLYQEAGVTTTGAPQREKESGEYGACRLVLAGRVVVFRVAKITPKKIGQFVTLWKRPGPSKAIVPLDSDDGVDMVVVSVANADHRGQFVFDRQTLLEYGVMSRQGQGGKRAIRVYPPWSKPAAKDALKAQQWQLRSFVSLAPADAWEPARLRQLLHL